MEKTNFGDSDRGSEERSPDAKQNVFSHDSFELAVNNPNSEKEFPSEFAAAVQAWKSNLRYKAIALFATSAQKAPDNPVLLVNLARAYGMNFQYGKYSEITNEIVERFGDEARINFMLAESDLRLNFHSSARQHLDRAIDLGLEDVHSVRANVMLAQVCEQTHCLPEALEAVTRALTMSPNHPLGLLQQAKVFRRQGKNLEAARICTDLTQRAGIAAHVKAEAFYLLAKFREELGAYDAAFEAAVKAKSMYQGQFESVMKNAVSAHQRNRKMLQAVTPSTFKRWRETDIVQQSVEENKTVWLVGHPRSGTTLLGQILGGHRQVAMADELTVFAQSTYPTLQRLTNSRIDGCIRNEKKSWLDFASNEDLQSCREQFFNQIEGAIQEPIGDHVLLNKNPDLTALLPGIGRIFPAARFIFAIRDPRAVVVSSFMQHLPLNPTSVGFFSIESTATRYAQAMNIILKFRDVLGDDFIEVRYEDVVSNLEIEARKAIGFLGLQWDHQVLDYASFSKTRKVNSPTYLAVTKPIYKTSVDRWLNYQKYLEPVYDLLVPYCRAFGYDD